MGVFMADYPSSVRISDWLVLDAGTLSARLRQSTVGPPPAQAGRRRNNCRIRPPFVIVDRITVSSGWRPCRPSKVAIQNRMEALMQTQPPNDTSALRKLSEQMTAVQAELAAIKELLQATSLTREQYASYIGGVKQNLVVSNIPAEKEMETTEQIPLKQPNPRLLKPGKKHQQKYKHHCKVCDGEWIGDEPAPPSCNYCRSTIWQTGETKWALRRKNQTAGSAVVA